MNQNSYDFSPFKNILIEGLQNVSADINKGIESLENEKYCLLGKQEDIKERIKQIETVAAFFYLNCYLSPFTDKY